MEVQIFFVLVEAQAKQGLPSASTAELLVAVAGPLSVIYLGSDKTPTNLEVIL